jgi:iron(III) transport system ATP-binding protein
MTLELTDLSKSFGTSTVLERVSVAVERGSRLAIVGASGTGKSTLLRIIAGFERPTTGTVRLRGRVLASPDTMISAHRRGIGYVAQDGALFPHLTVQQNIEFGLRRSSARADRVCEVLDLTSLDEALSGRYPHQLSGGQQQRVALARALAPAPTVILLDEPFSALDTGLRANTREAMVSALERSGVTTILVTHDQEEALSFGHQLAVIAGGRLMQSGPPSDLFDAPLTAEIAELLGDAVFLPVRMNSDNQAVCAFGPLRVRHDRSGGARRVRAMLRPSQLRVGEADDDHASARVISARQSGSSVELRLALGDPGVLEFTHRMPLYEAHRFRVGDEVLLSVDGGVVLYADTDAAEPTRSASVR